jgi:hypothetical protein
MKEKKSSPEKRSVKVIAIVRQTEEQERSIQLAIEAFLAALVSQELQPKGETYERSTSAR